MANVHKFRISTTRNDDLVLDSAAGINFRMLQRGLAAVNRRRSTGFEPRILRASTTVLHDHRA